MANNYTPSYNQYLTHTAGYALPSSVRSYSVFDPSSNSWRRMTNDGRSPMPASPASPVQQQADVAGALAQARQTQGTVYPAQGMTPTQTPGVFLRPRDQGQTPPQIPAQTPLGGPRMASDGQQRGGMGDSPSPASGVPQRGFKASGQLGGYLSTDLSTASQPTAYPEGYRAVVSPDNQVPAYTVNRNGLNVPSVSGVSSPEQVVQENVVKAAPPTINVADIAQRGLPEGFIKQRQKASTPSFYWDPSTQGAMNYNEEMKNLGRAINNDPETASRVGEVWGSTALAAAPVGAMVGALGRGAVWGARALAGTKKFQQLADKYRIVRNTGMMRGRQMANRVSDYLYNPRNTGPQGFEKYAQDQMAAQKYANMSRKPANFDTAETLFRTSGF